MSNDTLLPPPVNISQVLRSAAVFDFKRHASRQSFMDANNISQEAEELFDLLESRGVTYLLVGGLAMLTHVRGRNTDDVDLIISVPDQRRLEPEIVLVEPPEKGSPFALGQYKQVRVDYLDARKPIFKLVLQKYCERRQFFFGNGKSRELPVATAAGLMLLKLYALPTVGAQMDWDRFNAYEHDVLTLWMVYPQLEPKKLLALLRPHLAEGGLYSLEHEFFPELERRLAMRRRMASDTDASQ
jgi:hypothetical protein